MTTVPSNPVIYQQPTIYDNTVQYYWRPPVSNGGSNILGYYLECNTIPLVMNVVADKYWQKVGGLTNGKTYTFHVKAYNSLGNGNVSVFPDATPNKKTLPPSNIDFTMNVSNVLDLNWTTSATENFHPKNIEGLKLWLDASDSSNIILTNSNVSGWLDKSEFRYTFNQSNISKRPFLSNINGLNAIQFSGLSNTNSTFLSNALINFNNTRYSIFAVASQDKIAPSGFNYLLKGGDLNRNYYLQLGSRDGIFSTYTGNGGSWNDTLLNSPNSNVQTNSILSMEVLSSTLTPYFNGNVMTTKTGTTASSMSSLGFNTSYTTSNITISGNQFTSTIGGGGWNNSKFVSLNAYQYFRATVSFSSLSYGQFGVAYSNIANYDSYNLNYLFYYDSNYGVDCRTATTTNVAFTTALPTDIFRIEYDGTSVKYFKNNEIITEVLVSLTGPVYLVSEIYSGNFMNNVTFEELAFPNKLIGMTIGDLGILNGYNWNGKLGELLIYDSKLNPSDRLEIEGYLANKWKITNNLATTHPYKTIIPKSNPIFDPNSIGGLNFWIDASKVKNLANTNTISMFYNEGSFGNQGTTGTFNGSPQWIDNAINDMPAFQLNGSSQYLSFGNVFNLNSAISVFIVTKFTGNAGIIGKSSDVLKSGRWAISRTSSLGLNFLIDTTAVSPNIAAINDPDSLTSNPQIINAVWDKTNMYLYQNGDCKRILSNPSNTTYSTSDSFFIGVSQNSTGTAPLAGTYMNGYIGEVLIYNKQLTQVERESVEAYLSQKWRISINNFNLFKNSLVSKSTKVNPTIIPLISAWYDGADPLNGIAATNGQQISTWVDKSGNFRNATQTSASNRPTYLSSGGLNFNRNSNQFLSMNIPYSDNHTVFLVSTPSPFNSYYFAKSGAIPVNSPAIIDYGSGIQYYGGNDILTLSLTKNILNNISSNVANISADTFLTVNNNVIAPTTINTYTSNSTYTVPHGVVGMVVRMWGAGGGNIGNTNPTITGGAGAYIEGVIDVREGDVFTIEVGSAGFFNGSFGTGGGRTAILKTNNANAIVCVAGSGGGAGGNNFGGVATYGSVSYSGGSSYANQVLGNPAYPGSEAQNGGGASQSADGNVGYFYGTKGSGGAGYYYGGSGGEQYNNDGAGGAGSSFFGGLAFTLNSMNGNGITGGNSTSPYRVNNAGNAGCPGLVVITPITRNLQTTPNNFIASYTKNSGGIIQGTFNGELSNPFTSTQSYDNTAFNVIGNSHNSFGASNYLNGIIYELIFYNKILSKDERQLIEGYLAHKWGLTSLFPEEHPYKYTQPSPKYFPSYGPNLNLWIDASDRETINSSNSKVSFILDKSGKGFNLEQYDNRFKPNITNENLLSFTNNSHLNIPFRAMNNATGWALFLVIKPKGIVNYIMRKQDNSVDSYNMLSMTKYFGETFGSNYYMYFQRNSSGTLGNSNTRLASNNLQLIRIYYNGTTLYFHVNGNQTSTSTSNYALVDKTNGTCFTLGAWSNLSNTFLADSSNFELGELLFYNSALSSKIYSQIEGYLAEKWNIQNYLSRATQYSDLRFNTSKIVLSENLSNYIIDNILKIMPVDIRGNIITNDSGNTIVNTMRGTFNNKSFYIPNNNWSYRASLTSTSNIGHSDVVYTSTVFNPKIPSDGLKLWLDSYDTSTLTLSNNLVTKWNDKSKNFSNATINISNAPLYDNSNNLISFNGFQYLTLPNDTITSGNLNYTIFMYSITSNVSKLQWPLYSGTPTQDQSLGIKYNNSNIFHSWFTTESFTNQPVYSNIGFVSSYTYSDGIRNSYINGYLVNTSTGNIRNTSIANNYIGTDSSLSNSLVGSIGDILIYNRLLTNTERQSVEDYLKNRRTIFNTANLLVWFDVSSFSESNPNILIDRTYNGFRARPLYGNVRPNTDRTGIEFNGNTCLQINDAIVNSSNISIGFLPEYTTSVWFKRKGLCGINSALIADSNNSNSAVNMALYTQDGSNFRGGYIDTNFWTPNLANISIINNRYQKNPIGNSWFNSKLVSNQSFFQPNATVSFSFAEYVVFGLAYNNNKPFYDETNIDYSLKYDVYSGFTTVIENGNVRANISNDTSSIFSVRSDNGNIIYTKDNNIIYTSNIKTNNKLYLVMNIWADNNYVSNISFTDLDSLQRTGNLVSFPLNEWHNMTITVNNSFIKTYYDGNISNVAINRGNIASSNNLLTIGGSWNRTSNIIGDIGELLIYNKVLNDNEILNNFNFSKNKY